MRELTFLEQALTEGLLLTDHEVEFRPITDDKEFNALLNQEIYPKIERKLGNLDRFRGNVSDNEKQVLSYGVTNISGKIPMLCFTEIAEGRILSNQHVGFGAYGIIVKRAWLEENKAERVLYVGENSPISRALYRILMDAKIPTLHIDKIKGILWGQTREEMKNVWNLLSYVQVRRHLEELEWRIVGEHGFLGGERDTGKRLPIRLDDIDYVFVQNDSEVPTTREFIDILAVQQKTARIPTVLAQPEKIPSVV
ncbi:abortive infection system antitoxin AbiGi family protein [Undibacterium sp. Di26W]|uniref:abortive infection system antitoxin AbiGi family protein n=1 Tax=Undibacterium sp. Di26W TaxID=3413035 RepID=UPI003BF1D115